MKRYKKFKFGKQGFVLGKTGDKDIYTSGYRVIRRYYASIGYRIERCKDIDF